MHDVAQSPVTTIVDALITLGGGTIYENSVSVTFNGEWKEVAIVKVDALGGVCVEDLVDGVPTDDCPQ